MIKWKIIYKKKIHTHDKQNSTHFIYTRKRRVFPAETIDIREFPEQPSRDPEKLGPRERIAREKPTTPETENSEKGKRRGKAREQIRALYGRRRMQSRPRSKQLGPKKG